MKATTTSYTNGAAHDEQAPPPPARVGVLGASPVGPLDAVVDLGGRASSALAVGMVVALLLHSAAGVRAALIPLDMIRWTQTVSARIHDELWSDLDIVEEAKPVEPEPPPPPPPPEPEAKEEKVTPPPAPKAEKAEAPPPPPPAAAQAGAVMTSEPDPNEPVDLTNTFVTGTASTYAGGTTQAGGTSTTAVRDPNARAGGVPGGTGTAPAPAAPAPVVDRSRRASCNENTRWDECGFPEEADTAQVDEAYVLLRTSVGADGSLANVEILQDPGNGFGRLAKRCAPTRRCQPALDPSGAAIPSTLTVRVHFQR